MAVNESQREDPRKWKIWGDSGALGSINGPINPSDTRDIPSPDLMQSEHSQRQIVVQEREPEQTPPWRERLRYSLATSMPVAILGDMLWDINTPDPQFGFDFPYGYVGAVVGASTTRFPSQEQTVYDNRLLEDTARTVRSLVPIAPIIASGVGAYVISGGSVRDTAFNAICAITGRIFTSKIQKKLY